MNTDTNDAFLIRPGQTWQETNAVSGRRICVVDRVQGDVAHLRTVFDEGYIGRVESVVRLQTLLNNPAQWEMLRRPECPI
ncbi:hypothetical protein [Noviherbaspirillum pedocola]|jgi:hypothetical protein|uniref:Uncharacterized protein n=1 Tax=Noviherbaspirillum pedocola TaxID=2801341 RepID=A0A934WA09_9BURK|nr:hypothetical protein [Noviherbaspirillum pedocola]MBK4737934.1 hypothetical protein [Noviherbaspirillum pedocola]